MKTYEITIKPLSGFGTSLKGDTLFGHICWQAAYDEGLFGMSLDKLLADYATNPFAVISSAYPKLDDGYALKRPDLTLDKLFDFKGANTADIISKRKEFKGRRWMFVKNGQRLKSLKSDTLYYSDEQLFNKLSESKPFETQRQMRKEGIKSLVSDYIQPHNTINRLTGTTGEGQFAPYSVDQIVYSTNAELVIFAGLRQDIAVGQLITALERIGETGFGKDASTGLGRFRVASSKGINISAMGSDAPNACYTLAPSVPQKDTFIDMFFTSFTRFGRHGDVLAKSGKPFKNPVIMADEGAVLTTANSTVFKQSYVGTAVFNTSKAQSSTVAQGYSLYIPVRVEV